MSGVKFKFRIIGRQQLRIKNFSATNVNIILSGGSQAPVNMNGAIDADLSGVTLIYYYGKVKLGSTDFSSGSSISKGR